MGRFTCFVIFLLQVFSVTNAEVYYTISAPQTIRENSPYCVAVSVHDNPTPCTIKVGIYGENYASFKNVDVEPYSTELVKIQGPEFKNDYNLTVEGLDGIIFKHDMSLNFNTVAIIVLVQTDRAVYKPNDLVRYRVLILDQHTRPANIQGPIDVSIQDGKENKIKLWKNVILTQGVFAGELQLSDLPVLGDWKIVVEVDGQNHTQIFEVEKYVLPKFEVLVETATNTFIANEKIRATIRAKYTYGKSVIGEATISVYEAESDLKLITRKIVPIDGKARIEFDIENELKIQKNHHCNYIFIEASVEEILTGLQEVGSAEVNIYKDQYIIKAVKIPRTYIPRVSFEVKLQVTTVDGLPVQDNISPITAGILRAPNRRILTKNAFLDNKGIATFEFRLFVRHNIEYADVVVTYRGIDQIITGPEISADFNENEIKNEIKTEILTENPTIDGHVSVAVTFNKMINSLMYQIIGRGNILLSRTEQFADTNRHVFEFPASLAMAPTANLLVSTILDGKMYFDETNIEFEEQLWNFIKIDVPNRGEPGANIQLKISTNRDSYVGLLAVDQRSLLYKSGNDLTLSRVFHELKKYDTSVPVTKGTAPGPGHNSGLVTFTNANIEVKVRGRQSGDPAEPAQGAPFRTRTVFPETWIWESFYVERNDNPRFNNDGKPGKIAIGKKVPDTITSWIITGFSVNPLTGLGLTKTPEKLLVFQQFFVSTNLPYSVKRGEVLEVPIVVFNYFDQDLEAEVTLDNAAQEFEFTENPVELHLTESVVIPANNGKAVSFMIRPTKVGHIKIKVTATTPIAGDGIETMLLVELEGVTEYVNKATFIDLRGESTHNENFNIEIPEKVVPDSTHIEVSVVGNILGPTIDNLDKLIRLPAGCGEQNMVNFVPNVLILKYLKNNDKLKSSSADTFKKNLEAGYQKELSYKHPDGSYSAWGSPYDQIGSTWLTAYVARSFRQAAEYIHIEEDLIKSALQFLASNQLIDGSFPEVGTVVDKIDASGSFESVALTAFTLLAFIENDKHFPEYRDIITKALDFISSNTDASSDIYSLAISAYVLQLADHGSKSVIFDALETRVTNDAGKKYWQYKSTTKNVNVEVTAYAFLAMVEAGQVAELIPVFKWLVSQRNENGGFESTQDTVLGLHALFTANEKLLEENVEVIFKFGESGEASMTINNDNVDVLQSHEIPATTKEISVSASGFGVALVQLSYKYNVNDVGEVKRFSIKPEIRSLSTPDHLYLSVCTSFLPEDGDASTSTNMAVMEVNLPSGFTVDSNKLFYYEISNSSKKVETKNRDTVVVIYFDNLGTNEICPKVEAFKTHKVHEQKPAAILVYDYYDNSRRAREFYF